MIIQENLVENDKELLLMKTAFSDEFMEKVLKEYTKKEDWFLHAPCCIHEIGRASCRERVSASV